MRVPESITWANYSLALKQYLGLTTALEDALLQIYFATAVNQADQYLNRDFRPIWVQWTVGSGLAVDDVFSVTINDVTVTTTVVSGDTERTVAKRLRDALVIALAGEPITVDGYVDLVRVEAIYYTEPFTYDSEYVDTGGGTSSLDALVYWDEIPQDIVLGIFAYIKELRAGKSRLAGISSVTTDGMSESYLADVGSAALRAAIPFWRPYAFGVY